MAFTVPLFIKLINTHQIFVDNFTPNVNQLAHKIQENTGQLSADFLESHSSSEKLGESFLCWISPKID